jgi:hypothetical protein
VSPDFDPKGGFTASAIFRSPDNDPGTWELVNADGSWGLYVYPERGAMGIFKGDLYIEDMYGSLYRMKTH